LINIYSNVNVTHHNEVILLTITSPRFQSGAGQKYSCGRV